ncbi:hypothetical protein KAR91_62005 [Candidatus Pacearchaeota archaeon]|nr:hypothetical protein [Candidatus Pacearchaeota archaeon]
MSKFELSAQKAREVADMLNEYYATSYADRTVEFVPNEQWGGSLPPDFKRELPIQIQFDCQYAQYRIEISDREAINMLDAVAQGISRSKEAIDKELMGFPKACAE